MPKNSLKPDSNTIASENKALYQHQNMKANKSFILFLCCAAILWGCRGKGGGNRQDVVENREAKQLLQGIWLNEDDEEVAFMAKGDSIYYTDSTSQPARFMIVGDSLWMIGANTIKYVIIKQAPHLFYFQNGNGDLVKLVKSENTNDRFLFSHKRPQAINQKTLIKRDTVVTYGDKRYHLYVQINPTTYKVFKTTYNDDGVEVDNVYYDNIIHIAVFCGAKKLFSRDFRKTDFRRQIPSDFLRQSIFSDMTFLHINPQGIHFTAAICIPDDPSSYLVDVAISFAGKLSMGVVNH